MPITTKGEACLSMCVRPRATWWVSVLPAKESFVWVCCAPMDRDEEHLNLTEDQDNAINLLEEGSEEELEKELPRGQKLLQWVSTK